MPLNLLHKYNNPRLQLLKKDKNNNKFNSQLISAFNNMKTHLNQNMSSNSINKNKLFNKNNIIINNSINHIINNITINDQTPQNIGFKNNKSSNLLEYVHKKPYMNNEKSLNNNNNNNNNNKSRNSHSNFLKNLNNTMNYKMLNNKLNRKQSYNLKNSKLNNNGKPMNYKLQLFLDLTNNATTNNNPPLVTNGSVCNIDNKKVKNLYE